MRIISRFLIVIFYYHYSPTYNFRLRAATFSACDKSLGRSLSKPKSAVCKMKQCWGEKKRKRRKKLKEK